MSPWAEPEIAEDVSKLNGHYHLQMLSLMILESKPKDLLAAVKILAGSTVEIAAASVGDGSLVQVVQKMEEDSKASGSLLEVAGTEIQEELEELMFIEAAVEEVTAAATEEEMKSAEAATEEDEQEAPPAAEEAATLAATVKLTPDAEDQVTGADPDMDSWDIPPADPAPEEATHEEAAKDEETGAEKVTPAEEAASVEDAALSEEATKNEGSAGSGAAPPAPLCHGVGEMASPAAQGEQLRVTQ